jgi:hypothetical protein
MKRNSLIVLRYPVLVLVAVMLLVTSCGGKQARKAKFSGFLGNDYELLKKGGRGEALYVYVNKDAAWSSYNKILLDPVVIYQPSKKGSPPEDLQKVANNFYVIVSRELSKTHELVKEPGPRTLRIQGALTNVEKGSATGQAITSVIPHGIVASVATDFITGKPLFAGELSVEAKIIDARTGELLVAGVDRRIADKNIQSIMDSWEAVNKVLQIWSKMFAFRLCKLSGRTDCIEPVE